MKKIGILGFGFVGQAVYAGLAKPDDALIWDPPKGYADFYKETALNDCTHAIFVCLPTPMALNPEDHSSVFCAQDASYIIDALDYLSKVKYQHPVIVKSTVLPSVLVRYEKSLKIVANPEFLNANTAVHDFMNQSTILLGGNIDVACQVKDIYVNHFRFDTTGPIDFVPCSLEEAMTIKYIHNTRHAYEVLFWNYVFETFGNHRKYGALYEKITGRKGEMYKVAADGKLGYGGSCFTKDVNAIEAEKPHELTAFMIKLNERLRN